MAAPSVTPGPAANDGGDARLPLASVFRTPRLLRALGVSAWLLIGIALLLGAFFWALSAAQTIVGPLVVGGIAATVASPVVAWLQRHRLGRGWASLIVLIALVAIAALIFFAVLVGIVGQANQISQHGTDAASKLQSWLESMGVSSQDAEKVKNGLSAAAPALLKGLAGGLVEGIRTVAAIALGVSFTAFSLFFLLRDGPKLRRAVEGSISLPAPVPQIVVGRLIGGLRGYFLGVTIVAAFNGVVVTIGALVLGVPLAATIGVVTFALAYVPFIGAFVAGAFAVVIALGAEGTPTALGMLVVVILANGLLQNIVSPFAMGAALDMNPLLNLVVTVGAGCLFGMFGLVLASPLTSAALHVRRDLRGPLPDAQSSSETALSTTAAAPTTSSA